jgi:hypothetical protein
MNEKGAGRRGQIKSIVALVLVAALGIPSSGKEAPPVYQATPEREKLQAAGPHPLAEQYLSQLAGKLRARRKLIGYPLAGSGAAMAVLGGIALSQAEEDEWSGFFKSLGGMGLLAGGGVFVAAGAISLAVPTGAERENKRVGAIRDFAEREKAAADALAGLAKRGRRNRMIRGGVFSGIAVYGAASKGGDNIAVPLLFGAAAAANFLGKSSEEKAYLAFSEDIPLKLVPELVVGLTPYGGLKVGFSLDF